MKRKLIVLAGGLMMVALSAPFFTNKAQDAKKSLLMRNVEALARGEDDDKKPKQSAVRSDDECVIGTDNPYMSADGRWYNCQNDWEGTRNCRRYCGANK